MTKPNDSDDADFRAALPPELRKLDEELSAIRIEERPSFAPELERELAKEWTNRDQFAYHRPRRLIRLLIAAGLAGLMVSGVAVPQARAMVAQLIRTVVEEAFPSTEAPSSRAEPEMPRVQVGEAPTGPAETGEQRELSGLEAQRGGETPDVGVSTLPPMVITFPEIIRRDEAERIVSLRYPLALQRAGVGGSVKLMVWVNDEGVPEVINTREGSGYQSLNRAAMLAARELRFQPATRNGKAVGTWVEFDIHFVPGAGAGIGGPDPAGGDGIGGG